MGAPLHTPDAHERCTGAAWDEERVRAAVGGIAADAVAAFTPERLWPLHPLDHETPADAGRSLCGVYVGAAGVIWALAELGRAGGMARVAAGLDARFRADPDEPGDPGPGLWVGRAGILGVADAIAPDDGRRDALHAVLAANAGNPALDITWGAPGSLLAAAAAARRTGEARFAAVWRELADSVWDAWRRDEQIGCRIWTQRLSGRDAPHTGPAHGLAGCAAALAARPDLLGEARAAELARDAVDALTRLAVHHGGHANWPPVAGEGLERNGRIRTQWCHGAPGIVATTAVLAPADRAFTALLVAGGELTWHAGPLRSGPGLCHGTAGNGLAFLALHRRTGDAVWLERARRFGMHAIEQVERARTVHGRGRHSLWTGDPGVALYLRACIEPDRLPGIDIGAG
jgi:Lanthionine synthetase C-like protein